MHHRRLVVFPVLALWMSAVTLLSRPAAAQNTTQGVINGTAWQDTNPNFLMDPGEPPITGATVELWSTTSITGQPQRLQTTLTDALGRYQFTVNPINGPIPDFGCYQVRLVLPADLGGGVIRSQEICQVAAGGTAGMEFVVRGSVIVPPSGSNRAPSVIFLRVEPSGTQPGGTVRLQALGLDQDDDRLTYQWIIPAGTISHSESSLIDWTAPNQPGSYVVQVVATDPSGASIQGQVVVPVVQGQAQFNEPPMVDDVTASNLTPQPGQIVQLVLRASDPDGDAINNLFFFLGDAGGARVDPNTVNWQAPTRPGIYSTYAVVNDGRGGYGWAKRELSVNSAQTLNPSHPSYGRAGQVLIDSHGYLLWVGISDPAVAQQAATLAASGAQRFVLGHIVPDPSQRHGFYLDPATVSLAEVTAEGIQTNVEQVSRRPLFYMPGGAGSFDTWALSSRLIQFLPAP